MLQKRAIRTPKRPIHPKTKGINNRKFSTKGDLCVHKDIYVYKKRPGETYTRDFYKDTETYAYEKSPAETYKRVENAQKETHAYKTRREQQKRAKHIERDL